MGGLERDVHRYNRRIFQENRSTPRKTITGKSGGRS